MVNSDRCSGYEACLGAPGRRAGRSIEDAELRCTSPAPPAGRVVRLHVKTPQNLCDGYQMARLR